MSAPKPLYVVYLISAPMCAFMSMHLEDEAERKTLAYIMKAEVPLDIVVKKWSRVPANHKEWLWGKISSKIESDPNITQEQKARYEEVKKALKF